MKLVPTIFLISAIVLLNSCEVGLESIRYGEDQCHYCKMLISDPKFGSELVTEKGKVFKFDAAECMASYLKTEKAQQANYAFIAAIAYDTPGQLHNVNELSFLVSQEIPSPMGAFLSAYTTYQEAQLKRKKHQGTLYTWKEFDKQFSSIEYTNWNE